ncbi:MAG: bifunctional oligoribonuclease/PAP phosphatase NrnA [Clostridium butyricum]|jgi:phosphoesterase RecJ-like protein|nr:bifunctional oligoribonuclease/PAP phosphatase NrnA [Clostridium butyricum]
MNNINSIKEEILKANKIGLSFHTSPDGDAIGSTLGLLNALLYLNKEAYIISRDVISDNLSFLPLSETVNKEVTQPTNDTDLVIVLDCGNVERISAELSNYGGKIINIDHHISNEMYGFINYVDTKASATCEIVYLLLKELEIDFKSESEDIIAIGNCIYTGIVTDTGSYRHSNVTERTHKIASELIGIGIDNSKIHSNLFDNKPFDKVKLMGCVLSNIELELDGKVAVLEISKNMIEQFNLPNTDTSDIISIGLSVKGVEVALLLKEVDEGVKASLRSKNDIDVRKVAENFGGGGHIKAAGVMQRDVDLKVAKANLLKTLKEQMKL